MTAKRQLTQRGIPFEPLDNGIRSSDQAGRVQRIADTLDAPKIDAVFRKWLRRLPHPFAPAHRAAGYRYQLSILQSEFALIDHGLPVSELSGDYSEEVAAVLATERARLPR